MSNERKGALRAWFACIAGLAAWLAAEGGWASGGAVGAAAARGDVAATRGDVATTRGDVAPEPRLARIVEGLAQCAFDAMMAAAWADGVSPTAVVPPGLLEEIDQPTAVALLTRAQPERPRGAWDALRIGRAAPGAAGARGADGGPAPPIGAPIVYPATDLDLERACQLMVREAVVALLPAETRLPADLVRDLLERAPLPPTNPAADPALARRVQRLERAGRLSRGARLEADRVVAEFDAARLAAESWKARHDAFLSRVALLADGEEGRALVAIARRVQAARSGWSAVDPSTAATGTRSSRSVDEVARSVRRAVADGQACYALAETLVALEPISTPRIDSLAVSGEGRLRVGRSTAAITQESIDAWRRACGLQRSAVGWTGLSARPRPRPPKIRDAPFGIKPL